MKSYRSELERQLAALWAKVLDLKRVDQDGNFFELGGNDRDVTLLAQHLQEALGDYFYTVAVWDAPTPVEMAEYLRQHYRQGIQRWLGKQVSLPDENVLTSSRGLKRFESFSEKRAEFQRLVHTLPGRSSLEDRSPSVRGAVFVLCAPRSGSTLFRAMLAGHPELFTPPELNLLSFQTMGERRAACSGHYRFMQEGAWRAVMQILGCELEEAQETLAAFENMNNSVKDFYSWLITSSGKKLLIDKSTSYALEAETLQRAEHTFDQPKYIHLVRHPITSMQSFIEARFDRLLLRGRHPFKAHDLAELVWLECNQNIEAFLRKIPPERRRRLRYEDLVANPKKTLEEVCQFLEVDFTEEMLLPYENPTCRMIDGVYLPERMQGDPKFYRHTTIDSSLADRRKRNSPALSLSQPTRQMAAVLGYAWEDGDDHPDAGEALMQQLTSWNQTSTNYRESSLQALFEELASRDPGAVAVVLGETVLTYGELNQRAQILAQRLREMGAGAEVLVGICLPRSMEMILSLLAILKSGAAFLPLDPDYPQERLIFMVRDTQLSILITQSAFQGRFAREPVNMLILDELKENFGDRKQAHGTSSYPLTQPIQLTSLENLAYVIYTSGSTGQPKGVMVTQRGATNIVQAEIERFAIRPESRVLQFASLNFDTSIVQIFMALCAGASLYLVDTEILLSGERLVRLIRENQITHVDLPPAVLAALPEATLPDVKVISSGGEQVTLQVVQRWAKGRRFFNCYGTTETSICSMMMECHEDLRDAPAIGQPVANTSIYILDEALQPVIKGEIGELYIGGIGVARGYLRQPKLSAERFLPDPFCPQPGGRMYRTGDLARFRSDEIIEFIGRVDDQVKVRGYRIEPGEIQAVLMQYPDIIDAVVLPRQASSGEMRLVAYIVIRPTCSATPCEETIQARLSNFLSSRLPGYMLPAAVVCQPFLPRTPANKIDRQALPQPDWGQDRLSLPDSAAPGTALEQRILDVWRDVLGVDRIGIHDSFFDLGGHSLLIMRVHDQLTSMGYNHLRVLDLFRYTTVSSLARFLEQGMDSLNGYDDLKKRIKKKKQRLSYHQKRK